MSARKSLARLAIVTIFFCNSSIEPAGSSSIAAEYTFKEEENIYPLDFKTANIQEMLKLETLPDSNILKFYVDGYVDGNEYAAAMKITRSAVKEWSKVYIYEQIDSFKGMPVHCFFDDLAFRLRMFKSFPAVAVVTDIGWIKALVKIANALLSIQVRHFDRREATQAMDWLKRQSKP